MDIEERPMEDDTMEYEEAPPEVIPIETDATLDLGREDEVMVTETTTTNPISIDADVDLEAEYDEGDEMEPEPTPIPGAEGTAAVDPFFAAPSGVMPGPEAAGLATPQIETRDAGEEERVDVPAGTALPLTMGGSEHSAAPGEAAVVPLPSSPFPQVASSSSSLPAPVPSQTLPEAAPIDAEAEYEEGAEEEEEYYYEDDPTASTSAPPPAAQPSTEDDGFDSESSSEIDLGDEADAMLTIDTLPTVLLHLPNQTSVSLFSPPDPADDLPADIAPVASVWFAGKQVELAQAPLADLLVAIKAELLAAGQAVEGKELTLQEHGLGLKLGEHDKHLANVTLLEYLQIHHSCGIDTFVEFHIASEESRFWDRFDAIRKELDLAAEARLQRAVAKAEMEEVKGFDEEEYADEGLEVNDEAPERYEVAREVDARPKEGAAESAHPHADWANTLGTAPLAYGIGNVGVPNVRAREADDTHDDAPAGLQQNNGRSSRKDDEEPADTTQASAADSQTDSRVPMDEIALREAGLKGSIADSATSDVGGEDHIAPLAAQVPKDEIALMEEREKLDRELDEQAEGSSAGDKGSSVEGSTIVSAAPLASSSLDESASGLNTPAITSATTSETGYQPHVPSRLANEVLPDGEDATISTIPEGEAEGGPDGEYDDEEEEYYEEDGEEVTGDAATAAGGAEYAVSAKQIGEIRAAEQEEAGDDGKTALQIAVEDGVVPEAAAVKAVGGQEEWDEGYEDVTNDTGISEDPVDPYAKPLEGEVSPATSTTVEDDLVKGEDDDDEGYYDEEEAVEEVDDDDQASPVGSVKRRADDEDGDITTSVKRTRFPAQRTE